MKIFLKTLDKLKKPKPSEQECKYDKGWNDAIKKVEELICSYSHADMWIPTDLKLPPEPDVRESPEDRIKYNVTIKDAELPTNLTYLGGGRWGMVKEHGLHITQSLHGNQCHQPTNQGGNTIGNNNRNWRR